MELLESFRNIAEIAITIIGFSALISIFQKQKEEWKHEDKINLLRFYVMLEQAVFLLILCYLPVILTNYYDPTSTIIISSAFAGITCLIFVIFAQLRNKRVCGKYIISNFNYLVLIWVLTYVFFSLGNAFEILGPNLEANYLSILYYLMIMCIFQFMRLIYRSLSRSN